MAEYAPVQETLAPAAGPPIDPDVLDQRRKLAQALIAQAMGGEPIGSWTQGVAKLAQALMGGYNVRKTNQQEAAGRASGAADTAAALEAIMAGGGTADLPGTEAVSSSPTADVAEYLSPGAKGNAAYVYQGMLKRGATPAGAAAFAASMQQESGFNPNAYNPGEGAISGIQWRGPRAAGLKAFGAAQGKPWNTLDTNMDYAVHEMKTTEAAAGQAFFNAKTPEEANRALKQYIRYGDKAGPAGSAGWDFRKRLGNTRRILEMQGGGGGETAALPNVDPVSDAPTPDVAAFLGGGTRANPRVVYPPSQPPPAPVPNAGMGELTGSGTRAGPDYVPAPAPIGRGATAAPVVGTPMPTRPTVTGYPAIAAALQAPPANYDPTTMPRPVPPPDALGRTTPGTSGPYAMPQPIPQGGHTLMAQQPPAPLPQDNGLALLDPSAVPSSIDAPTALTAVPPPQQDPRTRAIQAVVQAQGRTDAPILASADIPALPRARPAGPLPSMPPGQQVVAPIQPSGQPLARAPQPRPTTPLDPAAPAAAAPATTASVPQPQRRAPIFREPYPSVLSAQEFARQGQNYLTGRPSFPGQQAAAPAQPRRGLLQALLGRGGPQAPAAAQAAPAGSPVAAGATAAPVAAPAGGASSRVSALLANPYVSDAVKAAVLARLMPKDKPYVNVPAGGTVYDPNTNKPLFTSPAKPEKPPSAVQEYEYAKSQGFKGSFEEWELQQKRAGAQPIIVGAGEKSYTVERGKLLAKQFGDIQDAGVQAQGRMGTLDAMEQALGKTDYTGWGAPQLLEAKRAAKLLGIDTGDLGAAETAQAISNQLAMQLRNPSGGAGMPGAMSDADRNFLKASVLGIERTPEGNARLLDYNRRLEQRSIDVAQQASDYAAAHGGLLDDGFGSELAKWAKANPLFPEAAKAVTTPKAGATSGGVKWTVEP